MYIVMEDKNWEEFEKYKYKFKQMQYMMLDVDGKKHLQKKNVKNKQKNLKIKVISLMKLNNEQKR